MLRRFRCDRPGPHAAAATFTDGTCKYAQMSLRIRNSDVGDFSSIGRAHPRLVLGSARSNEDAYFHDARCQHAPRALRKPALLYSTYPDSAMWRWLLR